MRRESSRCAVTLHTTVAVELLTAGQPLSLLDASAPEDEREALHQALRDLSHVSDAALRDDDIADAIHHAVLAYVAAR